MSDDVVTVTYTRLDQPDTPVTLEIRGRDPFDVLREVEARMHPEKAKQPTTTRGRR